MTSSEPITSLTFNSPLSCFLNKHLSPYYYLHEVEILVVWVILCEDRVHGEAREEHLAQEVVCYTFEYSNQDGQDQLEEGVSYWWFGYKVLQGVEKEQQDWDQEQEGAFDEEKQKGNELKHSNKPY